MIRNSLVLLVLNELDSIKKLYNKIPLEEIDELVVIDGGSTDGTVEFLRSKNLKIYIQKQKGRGVAFLEGLKRTKGENIVFFSGDGNENPQDIMRVFEYLGVGYDMVIGGRFILNGSKSDDSDDILYIRKFGNIFFSLIARIIWKTGVFDAINGFRGMKRSAMKKMNLDATGYDIEYQSTIRAAKLKLRIKEIPTIEQKRLGGERKPSAGTLKLGFRFARMIIREL